MSVTKNALRQQRRLRLVEIALLAAGVAIGIVDVLTGSLMVLLAIAIVAVMAWALRLNTVTVRRIKEAARPRPDYTRIASLEREVYGKTFEHEGAPEIRIPGVPPTMPPAPPMPRPRRKQTLAYDLEDDRRAMRALAAQGRVCAACTAPLGDVRYMGRTGLSLCPECHKQEYWSHSSIKLSNLRWERPS